MFCRMKRHVKQMTGSSCCLKATVSARLEIASSVPRACQLALLRRNSTFPLAHAEADSGMITSGGSHVFQHHGRADPQVAQLEDPLLQVAIQGVLNWVRLGRAM